MLKRMTATWLLVVLTVCPALAQTPVQFPSPAVELIVGPQVTMPANPTSRFDLVQRNMGVQHGTNFPATPSLSAMRSAQRGGGRYYYDLDLDLAQRGRLNGRIVMLTTDQYMNAQYYDLGLCLYALYYRTSDPAHLALARKVTDSWWLFSPFNSGNTPVDQAISPRNSSLGGLILRALDGRPEMWDWLQRFTRYQFDVWVKRYVAGDRLGYGVRDGAYMLQYATWLGKVLPDSFPLQGGGTATNGAALRAQFLADAENAAVNYYVRLQKLDGSWRWDDVDNIPQADGGFLRGFMQPFMIGLLLHSLIDVYRATSNATTKATLKTSILKCVDHLYDGGPYMKHNAGIPGSSLRWRAMQYFYHGGTTVNPTKYVNGDYYGLNAPNADSVAGARQNNSTLLHAFGWAYSVTGDPKYAAMGNDIYDSIFGFTEDQVSNWVAGNDPKGYNQHYRAGGRYLAWRLGGTIPSPSPTPVPTPTPTPQPTPTPTPLPTPSPSPAPLPPVTCLITAPDSVIVPRNGTGKVVVTVTGTTTVVVAGSTGQVTVTPLSWTTTGTGSIREFGLRVKSQSRSITFQSPCGSRSVLVQVR